METRRALGAVAFFMGYLAAFPVHATFHIVEIQEVMAGANGNPAIQFIELTMLGPNENCQHGGDFDPESPTFRCLDESGPPDFSAARLFFFDAAGTPIGDPEKGFGFPHNTPIGGAGRSILVATQAFADLPTMPDPDFIMPPMVAANAGKVCYKNDISAIEFVTECLSYGAFSGDTEGFGSPAPALPITGAMSLRRVSGTANNAADFAPNVPAPCTNTGVCGTVASDATDVGVTQSRLIGPVPVGNNLAYILTVANNGPALAAEVTLVDTLPPGSNFVFAAPETCVFQPRCGLVRAREPAGGPVPDRRPGANPHAARHAHQHRHRIEPRARLQPGQQYGDAGDGGELRGSGHSSALRSDQGREEGPGPRNRDTQGGPGLPGHRDHRPAGTMPFWALRTVITRSSRRGSGPAPSSRAVAP